MKLTTDYVGIDPNDKLGIFELFYTLAEDEAFEKLGEELSKAGELKYSDENGFDPDEVEDWFFDNSEIADEDESAKEFYNQNIGRNDIHVERSETRVAVVNGVKFSVSAAASRDEMYNNREAQKMIELKIW